MPNTESVSKKKLLLLVLVVLISACGGGGGGAGGFLGDPNGGGGADTATLTSGATSTIYTEATSTNPPAGFDPYIYAVYVASQNTTKIYIYNGYSAAYNEHAEIHAVGNSAGTFTIADGKGWVQYQSTSPAKTYLSVPGSGSVAITNYGAVGGRVQGSFNVTNNVGQTMTGTFSATRLPDS